MQKLILAFVLLVISGCAEATPDWPEPKNDREAAAVDRASAIFPDAIAPPPYKYKDARGRTQMALYQEKTGVFWSPAEASNAPRFAYIKVDLSHTASKEDIRTAFRQILNAEGLYVARAFGHA